MRLFICLLVITLLIVTQSCSDSTNVTPATAGSKKKVVAPSVKVVTVKSEQPHFSITVPGDLKPFEQVSVYPKIKGFVKKIYVDRGSYVRRGQLLALLEAPEVGAQYAARESATNTSYQKYLFSKQAYVRLKEAARKNGAVATIELERAYAQYLGDSAAFASSRSEAAATGQMQKYLRITAPFSGVITGRYISEGALVGDQGMTGAPLFELAQQNILRLVVAIPEKQSRSLTLGTKASFTVVDYPGKTFSAILARNSGALDVSSRSVVAEFDIPNAATQLRAGQYAKVTIQLQRAQPTLWVPASSVVQAQSGTFVLKSTNNIARRVPVEVGIVKDTIVEVFGNLQRGDTVLLKGSEEVKDGTKIDLN